MDDNTALMALAGTGVAVVTAALALSGICKDDRTRSSTSVKKSASVKKQEKLARRKLAEKKRKEDAAAATAAREAEQVKAPKPTVKKNKRKHKGKKRRGGAKASDSRGSEDDLQAKYAISMEDDDGVGEWAQVTKVVTRTKSKRRDNQESASNIADESSASPARVERETQVTMLLHGCAPAVIGRGGSTVRDIQNNSGAKLKIDKETDRLTIIGTTEEIQVAKSLVEEVISNNSADKQSSRHAIRLSVPADRIGAVIGKGGSNIHIIESQTNCRLKMDRDANQVSISGDNMDDVTRAKTLVQESIEREGNSNRGVSYYGHEGPLGATVDLLSRQGCLAIIGRGGTTIQQIESESGARIKVDKESNVCELRGTDEQVEAARASILDVIAQLSPENVMTIPLTSKTIGTVIGRGGNTIQRIQDVCFHHEL